MFVWNHVVSEGTQMNSCREFLFSKCVYESDILAQDMHVNVESC